jgi:hypothetical protein
MMLLQSHGHPPSDKKRHTRLIGKTGKLTGNLNYIAQHSAGESALISIPHYYLLLPIQIIGFDTNVYRIWADRATGAAIEIISLALGLLWLCCLAWLYECIGWNKDQSGASTGNNS